MLYLSSFYFPGRDREWKFRLDLKSRAYQTIYPFYVLPDRGLDEIFFEPITILYGGNGSGKSTALNVIAEKLRLERETPFNRSPFFEQFVDMCDYSLEEDVPAGSRIVTSDDVFDFMLNLRCINEGIDRDRDATMEEFLKLRREKLQLKSMDDYEHLRKIVDARRMTQSAYTRQESAPNVREHSNGESSDLYFKSRIKDDTLCLLDEPENSLSPQNQLKLAEYITESARYCGNQFIISTHSPFLLALEGAKIINLDDNSKTARSWAELPGARAYWNLFSENSHLFE